MHAEQVLGGVPRGALHLGALPNLAALAGTVMMWYWQGRKLNIARAMAARRGVARGCIAGGALWGGTQDTTHRPATALRR